MNKMLRFLFLSLSLFVISAQAQDLIDGIYYQIDTEGLTATVVSSERDPYAGAIVIPASVSFENSEGITKTAKVTAIGQGAFSECEELTSLTMPAAVTDIEPYAFYGCRGLEHVDFPAQLTTIGEYAFAGCCKLAELKLPATVKTIGAYAFEGCDAIEEVNLAGAMRELPDHAFSHCDALKKFVIPASVTTVADNAFEKCIALTNLTIADGTGTLALGNALAELPLVNLYVGRPLDFYTYNTSALETVTVGPMLGVVQERLCYEAANLRSVTLSEGIRKIGDNAFYGCSSLESFALPASVDTLGGGAFAGCSSLTSIDLGGVKVLEGGALNGCSALGSVDLTNVKVLGSSVFSDCTSLADVTLPEGLQSVPDYLFRGCTSLKSVALPSTVKSIEQYAFSKCPIVSMSLPDGVASIAKNAFEDCRAFNDFSFGSSVRYIEDGAFNNSKINELRYRGTLADWLKIYFAVDLYPEDTNPISCAATFMLYDAAQGDFCALTDLVIPDGSDSIPAYAFSCMRKSVSVEFPKSFKTIGENAFYGCNFSTLTFHGVLAEYEGYIRSCNTLRFDGTMEEWCAKKWSMGGCISLYIDGALQKDVTIPESVREIKDETFGNCSSIETVRIPATTVSVGARAFYWCSNLKSVVWGAADASRVKLAAAEPADGYRIGDGAFAGDSRLSEIVLPENIASIGSNAFTGTSWLDAQPDGPMYMGKLFVMYKGQVPANSHVVIREGTTAISGNAFSEYAEEGFTVALPSSFTTIGESVFAGCGGLKGIDLPRGLVSIGNSAFSGCCNLKDIDLPEGLESIGDLAFESTGLTSVRIPSTVTTLYSGAFSYCNDLGSLYLADGTDELTVMSGRTEFAYGSPISILYLGRNAKLKSAYDGSEHVLYLGNDKLKELNIGANIDDMQHIIFNDSWNLTDITVLRPTPPAIGSEAFSYGTPQTATLHVPAGAESAYAKAEVWKDFLHITGEDLTGIGQVAADAQAQSSERHFDVSGRRVKAGAPGIHVVRSTDGTTRKVLVK